MDTDTLIGQTISHYRILTKLGEGGMGVVYKAEDTRLERFVALKFLPHDLVDDEEMRDRFLREARAASVVNHPNICTIHEIGEDDHRIFIAMEFLEGATLRNLVDRGPVESSQLFTIADQVLEGLETAHGEGVIHRDIKLDNIFATTSGRVKILDFGLAKKTGPNGAGRTSARDKDRPLPQEFRTSGLAALGTAAYMSPEQALGKALDARTDLFSFGIVLYEMATGRAPFNGETTGTLLLAIVRDHPEPVRQFNTEAPQELQRIIDKCLQKDRSLRYQTASEIRKDLARLQTNSPKNQVAVNAELERGSSQDSEKPTSQLGATRFSLRRPRWKRISIFAITLVVLGLATDVYWHKTHARVLTEKDTVVLADFSNSTGDAVFDDTLKQALAAQLQQSPFLSILPERSVRENLKLMGRTADDRVTEETALEICERSGSRAVIAGSIVSLGTEYVIGLNAQACPSGSTIAMKQARAAKKEQVLDALDHLSASLRKEVGESMSTIEKFDTPLAQATTPSLEALKFYSLGMKALVEKSNVAAVPLLKRAIELDPNFALAYASLGVAYGNLKEADLAKANYQRAFELRNHVSMRENYAISAYYYNDVTGEIDKANQTYELYSQAYPRAWAPHNNLGSNYAALGQWEKAVAETWEANALDPDSSIPYGNLVEYYCRLNRLEEAKKTYQRALTHHVDGSDLHTFRYAVAFLEHDLPEMRNQAGWSGGRLGLEDIFLSYQSDTEAYAGHLTNARELSRRATDSASRSGESETAARWELNDALREVEFGNLAEARHRISAALALSSAYNERILAALILARAGDTDRAQKLLDQLQQQNLLSTKVNLYWQPVIAAAIQISRKNPQKAIEILDTASPYELGVPGPQPGIGVLLYPAYLRGQAELMLHEGRLAAIEFRKFSDYRTMVVNSPLGPLAQLQLARAYFAQNDVTAARAAYQDFLATWKNADPDIPALRQANEEYARLH